MLALTTNPIDVLAVNAAVRHSGAGAVLSFVGDTRDNFDGRRVVRLEYEAYDEMVLPEMARIQRDLIARWPAVRLAMVHRTGVVPVGQASVVIAVSAPHRDEAYAASRFAIDTLKTRLPIWKREVYADGSTWKENQS
jgi:molybdopterin synthase catalytic subunit